MHAPMLSHGLPSSQGVLSGAEVVVHFWLCLSQTPGWQASLSMHMCGLPPTHWP